MNIKLKLGPDTEAVDVNFDKTITIEELMAGYKEKLPYRILIARVNGRDEELTYMLKEPCTVELLDIRTHSAYVAYQHTISLVYLKAVKDVVGEVFVEIDNSLNKGLYTEINADRNIDEELVRSIEKRMREIVEADLPIIKEKHTRTEGIELCKKYGFKAKERLLLSSEEIDAVKFYRVDDYRNFFYGLMAPSTGYVDLFELKAYEGGVLLRFPYPTDPSKLPEYKDDKNLHKAFSEAKKWQKLLDVAYLPDLNDKITNGGEKELILLSEALHEKKMAEMADMIYTQRKRIVLIAGPSSSGKTTTAKRLSVQLRVNGLEPVYIGTDDYFLEREFTPLGEDGLPNFEDLEALDIELFNRNMNELLAGEEADLPEFDFIKGEKIFGNRKIKMKANQLLIIEGIHALNGKLTEFIDEKEKFKIYISPFTQLNIDTHNRVPTADARMLRRMVRDYKYRNNSAAKTISQWSKVRAGEDKNIFPYNGNVDVVLNTALVYELAVLKKYAEPLLKAIEPHEPEYSEAVRLLEFIKYFKTLENEKNIPNNSIMREFIGGSIFVE